MMDQLLEAADNLVMVLEQENAALARLDLVAAARNLGRKQHAAASFATAQATLASIPPAGIPSASIPMDAGTRARITEVGHRLAALARENRQLLERGLAVQARVIGVIACAVPRAIAANAAGYRPGGAPAGMRRASAMALSARA